MTRPRGASTVRSGATSLATLLAAVAVAGCGGDSSVSAEQRIERCLGKQPDATQADCKAWEEKGELADDGSHAGH